MPFSALLRGTIALGVDLPAVVPIPKSTYVADELGLLGAIHELDLAAQTDGRSRDQIVLAPLRTHRIHG
jgi:hypothetical protein